MEYQFPVDIELRVRVQMESGLFNCEDDVLRAAVDVLEKRQSRMFKLRDMVRQGDADIAAGRVGPFDADATKKIVRKRLADQGITS